MKGKYIYHVSNTHAGSWKVDLRRNSFHEIFQC
jgi:hypothetical protein